MLDICLLPFDADEAEAWKIFGVCHFIDYGIMMAWADRKRGAAAVVRLVISASARGVVAGNY